MMTNVANGDNNHFLEVSKKHDFDLTSNAELLLWETQVKEDKR